MQTYIFVFFILLIFVIIIGIIAFTASKRPIHGNAHCDHPHRSSSDDSDLRRTNPPLPPAVEEDYSASEMQPTIEYTASPAASSTL